MKKLALAIAFFASAPAFANEFQFSPNRFFCYYRDSIGHSHGAGGSSIGQAQGRARSTCQEAERRRERFVSFDTLGSCTFTGCRQVRP